MPTRPEADDYYAILGVARTASIEEIRAAFRARAKQLHPDRSRYRDAKDAFQQLQSAYAVLARPERRRQYDLGLPAEIVEPPVRPPPSRPLWRFALVGLAMSALGLAAYWLIALATDARRPPPATLTDFERQIEADISRQAASFFALPPEPFEVEMVGREGRKYLVGRADYKRLVPVYERLVTAAKHLQERKENLDARRAALEKEGRELGGANLAAVTEHRLKVDAVHRDGSSLRRALETHAAEWEDYFNRVESVAISGR